MNNRFKIIACMTIAEELEGMIPDGTESAFMEFGLHSYPEKLKERVQEEIDRTNGVDAILLGYGLCAMSILGLTSPKHRLVIPRMHDCIGIFLGSGRKYREQVYSNPGTYYLTKGWINHGGDPYKVFKKWQQDFGAARAKLLLDKTIGNYTRLAYIETGQEDQKNYIDYAQMAAEKLDLKFEKLKGNRSILEKMLAGDWDSDFVIVEPGSKPTIYDFSSQ
ncbi:DUF1638 domain-containing protein [Chloroflexota bacterium]